MGLWRNNFEAQSTWYSFYGKLRARNRWQSIFLTHLATPHLDGLHSVFGKVINGQSVIYDIRRRDVINSISIQGDPTNLFKRKAEDLKLGITH